MLTQTWWQGQTPTAKCRPSFSERKINKSMNSILKTAQRQFGGFCEWWEGIAKTHLPGWSSSQSKSDGLHWLGPSKYVFPVGNLFAYKQRSTNGTCAPPCRVVCLFKCWGMLCITMNVTTQEQILLPIEDRGYLGEYSQQLEQPIQIQTWFILDSSSAFRVASCLHQRAALTWRPIRHVALLY